jgi:hypothetical protein
VTRRSEAVPQPSASLPAGSSVLLARQALRDRLTPLAYPLVVIVAVGVVFTGQLVEDLADGSANFLLTPPLAVRRWTLIALVLYELIIAGVVERTVRRSLDSLARVVRIDDAAFGAYAERMNRRDTRGDLLLLLAAAAISALLFLVMGVEPLADDPRTSTAGVLPAQPLGALLVLAGYTVVGWASARLLYITLRRGRQLGQLTREPLSVNVFDTVNLLPFGNIALAVALAPAGIIAILLLGLGAPGTLLGWTALVLATLASVLALLLPLRGIHRQMYSAKDAALATVNERISDLYDEVSRTPALDPAHATRLNQAIGALIPLRRTVAEMTTWPFRDTVALARAVLIASAPLIYTTLSELIKIFLGR